MNQFLSLYNRFIFLVIRKTVPRPTFSLISSNDFHIFRTSFLFARAAVVCFMPSKYKIRLGVYGGSNEIRKTFYSGLERVWLVGGNVWFRLRFCCTEFTSLYVWDSDDKMKLSGSEHTVISKVNFVGQQNAVAGLVCNLTFDWERNPGENKLSQ